MKRIEQWVSGYGPQVTEWHWLFLATIVYCMPRGPRLNPNVQRQKILKNYGEIATTTATEGEYGKKSALCRKK
jgi:hypothetical protein